jgi:hypothetical protein
MLAAMAHLEAASVPAFARLARELAAHGAPRSLRYETRRAMRDEIRHARLVGSLAEESGGRVPPVRARPARGRSLEAIAIDNAVEGCVRETFGAVVVAMQAARAEIPGVRRAMDGIAQDEARHALLSWRLAAWLDRRLDIDARARVRSARSVAVDKLAREVAIDPPERDQRALGLPSAAATRAVLNALRASMWS